MKVLPMCLIECKLCHKTQMWLGRPDQNCVHCGDRFGFWGVATQVSVWAQRTRNLSREEEVA